MTRGQPWTSRDRGPGRTQIPVGPDLIRLPTSWRCPGERDPAWRGRRLHLDVGQDLAAIATTRGLDTERVRCDVEAEVSELVAASIDADTHHSDEALSAYIEVVSAEDHRRLVRRVDP